MKKKFAIVSIFSIFYLLSFFIFASLAGAVQPGMVNTVLGPMPVDKLGATLVHEHFQFAYPGWYADATVAPENYKASLKADLEVCNVAKSVGIKTIIDATTNDVGGRNPRLMRELAKKSGVNIIFSTGLYTEHEGAPTYFKTRMDWYKTDITKMISKLFITEINQGVGKTGIKAGVIKIGSSPKMSEYEKAVHKAAVIAQKETGVPIITHTEGPTGGIEQAELLLQEGANPKKVMIGHVSNSKDLEYHKAILAKGVYVAFDRIGLDIFMPFDVIAKNVAALCKQGYANQIMLSHDTCNVWLGQQYDTPAPVLQALAGWRIDTVSKSFIPALRFLGVTDEQIKMMMVDNPRNLFLGK